jgi:hypothetical protein
MSVSRGFFIIENFVNNVKIIAILSELKHLSN